MTILDRLLSHDLWTTRQLLLRSRELSEEQLSRKFSLGNRSLRETFEHLISCMESHTDLLAGRSDYHAYRDDESIEGMLTRLTTVGMDFCAIASAVDRHGTADEMCINAENTKKWPKGSLIAHILTHSMHHRAQILAMFDELGVQDVIEGDALGWEGQARGWGYGWCNSYGRVATE